VSVCLWGGGGGEGKNRTIKQQEKSERPLLNICVRLQHWEDGAKSRIEVKMPMGRLEKLWVTKMSGLAFVYFLFSCV
jgi:hypothetical protein